jgi:hypothetical protein
MTFACWVWKSKSSSRRKAESRKLEIRSVESGLKIRRPSHPKSERNPNHEPRPIRERRDDGKQKSDNGYWPITSILLKKVLPQRSSPSVRLQSNNR